MAKLSSLTANRKHRVLLFGPPKSGKSKLAGGLAEQFDLVWFDLEAGKDVLFQLPEEQQSKIELIDIPDTRAYPIAIESMLKVIKGGKHSICETHGKVSCPICSKNGAPVVEVCLNDLPDDTIVVVDSLTQLNNSAMAHIAKNKPEDYKFEYDDWANLGRLMDMFLSHVQQAKYNIVCISHEISVKMEDGREKLVPVSGTTNFSRNTAKYFDEVVYCEVKNAKHVAASSTTYSNNILSGSRNGFSLEKMEGGASLLPIFLNEKPKIPELKAQTPAQNAATGLTGIEALKAKMKGMI